MEKLYKNRLKHPLTVLGCLPGYLLGSWAVGALGGALLGAALPLDGSFWGGVIAYLILLGLLLRIPVQPDYRVDRQKISILRWGRTVKELPFSACKIATATMDLRYPELPFIRQRYIVVEEGNQKQRIPINLKQQDVLEFVLQVNRCQKQHAPVQNTLGIF